MFIFNVNLDSKQPLNHWTVNISGIKCFFGLLHVNHLNWGGDHITQYSSIQSCWISCLCRDLVFAQWSSLLYSKNPLTPYYQSFAIHLAASSHTIHTLSTKSYLIFSIYCSWHPWFCEWFQGGRERETHRFKKY